MEGGDRCLDLVRTGPASLQRRLDEGLALGDSASIPPGAVLVLEQDEITVRVDARLPPRVVEQHQGEEPDRLRLVREQRDDDAGQPDRLRTQLTPDERIARGRRIALVVDEIEHLQNAVETVRQEVSRRD